MLETVNQETNGTAPAEQEERTFTQAEMNVIIADRLNRERGKYSDYEELKAQAAQTAEAQRRADELQKKLDDIGKAATLKNIRQKVSEETGVPVDLLTGETEAACKAQARKILDFANPGYPEVEDGGSSAVAGRIDGNNDYFSSAFDRTKKHSPKQFPPASLF